MNVKKHMAPTRCLSCMEEHDIQTVRVQEENIFKGEAVEYTAEYTYCERTGEMLADEQQISQNDINMKNAYREKKGLLLSHQIAAIREAYGISQSDLCLLLGWGAKTITRYEGHQVQDMAHDMILRKLASDPAWFLQLLTEKKDVMTAGAYTSAKRAGTVLFATRRDTYLEDIIAATYTRFQDDPEATGNRRLSLQAVVDMITTYANAASMRNLFSVKLMGLLWYADALSYKRRGYSISGLVYLASPTGVVPVEHRSILDLSEIPCEETDFGEGTGCHFYPTNRKEYPHLSAEDRTILDTVIERFGEATKEQIVSAMHEEDAIRETDCQEVIPFRHALSLSLA